METADTLILMAARLQAAWEAGRICSLVARGCRARIARIARLVEAGDLDADLGIHMAREAEGIAFHFAPLPGGRP